MSTTPAHHADAGWREPFDPGTAPGRTPMGRHEALARTAAALDAQRVELYSLAEPTDAVLVGLWTPFDAPLPTQPTRVRVPQSWFPWSLGNIRPEEYMFVRNAAALPAAPAPSVDLGVIGMSSCLHLPVLRGPAVAGALCVYWSVERDSWPSESRVVVCSWALDALSQRR